MNKIKYKVEVVVEVENSDWNKIGHDRVKRNIICLVGNALERASDNGVECMDSEDLSVSFGEIKIVS